jgi:hypothetical protein
LAGNSGVFWSRHHAIYMGSDQGKSDHSLGFTTLRKPLALLAFLAEREGFEPSVPLPVRQISNLVPSTTRPPLRAAAWLGKQRLLTAHNALTGPSIPPFSVNSWCRLASGPRPQMDAEECPSPKGREPLRRKSGGRVLAAAIRAITRLAEGSE